MSLIFQQLEKITKPNFRQWVCSLSRINKQYISSTKPNNEPPQWQKLMYNADGSIKDYYNILGVQPNASYDEIKKTYYDLNKLLHPDSRILSDTNLDDKTALNQLREAQESWNVLRSRKRRAEYDSERKRLAMLFTPDVEELVHDITGWVSKTDKDKTTLHEKVRQAQFANYQRFKQENADPNTFIQMAHKKTMFNRRLAREQEIAAKESMDVKARRQRTLNYKLWKEKMDKKNSAFGSQTQTLNDPYLNEKIEQLSDINDGNRQFYQKLQDIDVKNVDVDKEENVRYQQMNTFKFGPTPNAYAASINPRVPFGGDEKLKSESISQLQTNNLKTDRPKYAYDVKKASVNPEECYDENTAHTMKEEKKIKIQRTVNIEPGIGDIYDEIKGEHSSNPDANKHHRDFMRQRIYEEWKEKEKEKKFKRRRGEPLKIEGTVDESVKGYTWYENVGSNYCDGYREEISKKENRLYDMKGVGDLKMGKSYNAFDFNMDTSNVSNYYNGSYGSKSKKSNDFNSSNMANSMIFGHIGIISAVLFLFVSWNGAKLQ